MADIPRKKKSAAPVFDQNFIDTFQPKILETVSGVEITGRNFTIRQWSQLKTRFKKWQGFNIGDLLLENEFDAVLELCWLAVGGLNDHIIPTKEHLAEAMNATNYLQWAMIWRPACGLPMLEDDDEDLAAEGDAESGNAQAEAEEAENQS